MDDQVEKELLEWNAAMATEDWEGDSNNAAADDDQLKSRLTRRQVEECDAASGAPKGDKANP